LVLENGAVFEGECFGAEVAKDISGEVIFITNMTDYQDTLTNPEYRGKIVVQTFPLIGNYGIISEDFKSDFVENGINGASAIIVKYPCQEPSNFRSEGNLDTFLRNQNIVGLQGIDTRKLTKIIRNNAGNTIKGCITTAKPANLTEKGGKTNAIG